MSIGKNIKQQRNKCGISQSELADLIGVSDKTISSWEIDRTEPKMGMVEKICTALKCKKTDIVGSESDFIDYSLTSDELSILIEYRKSDHATKDMIRRLLAYKEAFDNNGGKK